VPATGPAIGQRVRLRAGGAEHWWEVVKVIRDPVEEAIEVELLRVEP
jgi:hypothetical protein